jgi:hypothetical protein
VEYSAQLIEAIGEWQNGWGENGGRRLAITQRVRQAISSSSLSDNAKQCSEQCYRKRFLVPNNSQNGGDLKPLILDGRIEEGVASWTTNFDYAKDFKDCTRPNNVSAVFAHLPSARGEVVLNVKALWSDAGFAQAVSSYAENQGKFAGALQNFKALQHEVILDTPLLILEVEAFCDRISGLEHLYGIAELTTTEQQDEFWRRMVETDTLPGDARWLNREKSQRAIAKVRDAYINRAQ